MKCVLNESQEEIVCRRIIWNAARKDEYLTKSITELRGACGGPIFTMSSIETPFVVLPDAYYRKSKQTE